MSCLTSTAQDKILRNIENKAQDKILRNIENTAQDKILRNIENTLFVAKARTNYSKKTFSYDGAKLWNDLPQSVRAICSLNQFKREIHNLIFIVHTDCRTAIL